jgi:transcriptional regulator with XRE-family HTH domain
MNSSVDIGLGMRLRRERERRRITLSSIAANTKISISLLQGLEGGDVSRWPSGIFRRSFIRSYASAIGLDADEIAKEFLEQYPDPNEPAPAASAALPPTSSPSYELHRGGSTTLRLKLDSTSPFLRGRLLAAPWRRCAAAAWDVAAVSAMGAILYIGLGEFWMSFALATVAYYASSIVLLGNTPGVSFFAAGHPSMPRTEPQAESPTTRSRLRLFTRSAGL